MSRYCHTYVKQDKEEVLQLQNINCRLTNNDTDIINAVKQGDNVTERVKELIRKGIEFEENNPHELREKIKIMEREKGDQLLKGWVKYKGDGRAAPIQRLGSYPQGFNVRSPI